MTSPLDLFNFKINQERKEKYSKVLGATSIKSWSTSKFKYGKLLYDPYCMRPSLMEYPDSLLCGDILSVTLEKYDNNKKVISKETIRIEQKDVIFAVDLPLRFVNYTRAISIPCCVMNMCKKEFRHLIELKILIRTNGIVKPLSCHTFGCAIWLDDIFNTFADLSYHFLDKRTKPVFLLAKKDVKGISTSKV